MEVETCFVVLWSQALRSVHIQTAAEMAETNRMEFLDGTSNGFVVLEFCPDHDTAQARASGYLARRNAEDDLRG